MNLFFVTGNSHKFNEVKALIPSIEQLDIPLEEIQALDERAVIQHKIKEARAYYPNDVIMVEDTSLRLDGLNGLPGPLIKWFLQTLGTEGIYTLVEGENTDAVAQTTLGVSLNDEVQLFTGSLRGSVVKPRGKYGFGWDALFQPDGYDQTFAQMGPELKQTMSMRRIATEKLVIYLQEKGLM